MKKRNLKALMVVAVLIPVILTVFLARSLYQRKGVPEALESLTRQLFMSKEDERKAEEEKAKVEVRAEELKSTYDALIADLKGEVESKEIKIRKFKEKLEINFVDKVLFVSGSAEITPQGREILGKVGAILEKIRDKKIYVVGHTDNVPIRSFVYPSNWELSTARSSSVCRFLIDGYGIDPRRFTAMGKAFYQPVAKNDTAEGRQENRRVEIIIADFPGLEGESGEVEMRSPVGSPYDGPPVKERELGSPEDVAGEGVALPGLKPEEESASGVKKPETAAPEEKTSEEKTSEKVQDEKVLEEKVKTEEKFFKDALTTPEAPAAPEAPKMEEPAKAPAAEMKSPEEPAPPAPAAPEAPAAVEAPASSATDAPAAPAEPAEMEKPAAPAEMEKPAAPAEMDKPAVPSGEAPAMQAPPAVPAPEDKPAKPSEAKPAPGEPTPEGNAA